MKVEQNDIQEIAYYPGCSLHASSKLYDIQCRLVCKRLGIELREIEDWSCCGTSSAGKTDAFLAAALPARNLGIADATGLPELLIPCSSCYSRTMAARKLLQSDKALRETINAGFVHKVVDSIKVSNILEVLLPKVDTRDFQTKVVRKLSGLRPACYYGCLLSRFPCDIDVADSVENPQAMEIICEATGAEPTDWNYKTDCCGASAVFNDKEQSLILMSRILKDAAARGANCLVTSCPLCQLNMDAYQEEINAKYGLEKRLPVYFITELIGASLGIDLVEMQVDRHIVDAMRLLHE